MIAFTSPRQDGKTVMAYASCCLWQPDYYNRCGINVKIFFRIFAPVPALFTKSTGTARKQTLLELRGGNLDAGAHGGGQDAASDILALGGGGLCLDDRADQVVEVLSQLFRA